HPLRFSGKEQPSVAGSVDWAGLILVLAVVGQRSHEVAGSVPEEVGTVVCGPQLVTRICDQTNNRGLCLCTGIALANGHKSLAIIPDQPFAGADPEVAIGRLR